MSSEKSYSPTRDYSTRRLSDARIPLISGHESKKGLEIDPHLSLDAVKQAYREAIQSVSIYRTPNNARNHRPVSVLVPLLEFNDFGLQQAVLARFNILRTKLLRGGARRVPGPSWVAMNPIQVIRQQVALYVRRTRGRRRRWWHVWETKFWDFIAG